MGDLGKVFWEKTSKDTESFFIIRKGEAFKFLVLGMFLGFNFAFGDVPKIVSSEENVAESLEIIKKPSVNLGDCF